MMLRGGSFRVLLLFVARPDPEHREVEGMHHDLAATPRWPGEAQTKFNYSIVEYNENLCVFLGLVPLVRSPVRKAQLRLFILHIDLGRAALIGATKM